MLMQEEGEKGQQLLWWLGRELEGGIYNIDHSWGRGSLKGRGSWP